jgi:hypothetical protein
MSQYRQHGSAILLGFDKPFIQGCEIAKKMSDVEGEKNIYDSIVHVLQYFE